MHENGRVLRIADFIRDEIAVIIQQEMRDPRVGMVSVNEVSVSKDLSWADVYVSSVDSASLDERVELIAVLNKASGYCRSEVAKRHTMRTTPEPRCHYGEIVEEGPRMEALIESAIKSDVEQAGKSVIRQAEEDE